MDNGCLGISNFEGALALIGEEQYNVAELALAKFFSCGSFNGSCGEILYTVSREGPAP